jgi:hypothetical protein
MSDSALFSPISDVWYQAQSDIADPDIGLSAHRWIRLPEEIYNIEQVCVKSCELYMLELVMTVA